MDEGKILLSSIKQLQLPEILRMDQATFSALQIFQEDIHPNVIKGKGKAKEGFSLFCLFDRTHSQNGRVRLREWMRKFLFAIYIYIYIFPTTIYHHLTSYAYNKSRQLTPRYF